jgi:hypothetical protein
MASSLLFGFRLGTDAAEGKENDEWADEIPGAQLNFDGIVKELEAHYEDTVVPMLTFELDNYGRRVKVANQREFTDALHLW